MSEKEKSPVLIDVPMPVETPRLLLRPVMPGDGAAMSDAVEETRAGLTRWMSWINEGNAPGQCEERARRSYAKFILREDIFLTGVEKATDRPVIWTGLHRIDWPARRFEIGYWVRQSAQGRGYATESTNALVRFVFNALAARRVRIDHAAGNEASRRVIEKLGFAKEGTLKGDLFLPDGAMADRVTYGRLSPDGLPPLDVRWGPP